MATFERGQRVRVKMTVTALACQTGTVAYQRMAAPDYTEAEAVSVVLDSQRDRPGYTGTILAAADVEPVVSLGPWRRTAANNRGVPGPGPEWD